MPPLIHSLSRDVDGGADIEFRFISFSRAQGQAIPPLTVQETSGFRQRDGVDGTDIRKLGKRGQPFEMFSVVDCDTLADALDLYADYAATVGDGFPYDIIWHDLDFTADRHTQYHVLDVEQLETRTLLGASGGLSTSSGALLRCRWLLMPVAAPVP
jgi:hypothetical protein